MLCSFACLPKVSQLVPRAIAVEPIVKEVPNFSEARDLTVKLTDPVYAAFALGSTSRLEGVAIKHGGFF